MLIILIPAPLAQAADTATIKLKSGEEYKDVIIDVNYLYNTILIEYQGQKINFNFSDIQSISTPDGSDITSLILEAHNEEDRDKRLSERSKKLADNRPWRALFSFGSNYSIPSGRYYEGLRAGFGFDGDMRFAINDRIALQFIASRSGMQLKDNVHAVLTNPNFYILDEDLSARAIRYEVAVNFFQPLFKGGNSRNMVYVLGGLGAVRHSTSIKVTVVNNTDGETARIEESSTNSKLTIIFGFGAVTMLSKHFGLDFSGTLDMVAIRTNEYYSGGKGINFSQIFDMKISAVAMF